MSGDATGSGLKVAHLMAGAPAGGAELFFERLNIALHDMGDLALPVIRRNDARAERLRQAGLSPLQMRFGGTFDLLTRFRLRRNLDRFDPRVVVAWMRRAAVMAPRGPWVLAGRLGGYYDLSAFTRCDYLISNTRSLGKWIARQGWPEDRIHYLPNFSPDFSGATPDRMGVPAETKLILASGRLHKNKAFDVLINAMAQIPDAYLIIAGEGPERDALEALARRCGVADRVKLPGWVGDIRALVAGCDVFTCPSRSEVLGNVVLEAWSASKPVVAAAADGPLELITPNEDGMIVPIDDADALAASLRLALEIPELGARLAQAGRVHWEYEYSAAPVLAAWRQFLMTVERP